jgi:hypothetical protein
MADRIEEFFQQLATHGHEPLLAKVTGTCRFDLTGVEPDGGRRTDHWIVRSDAGDISVSHENVDADCVVRADRALFEGIVRGEVNSMAAMLRGALSVEGNLELLMLIQRLLPGRVDSRA